MEEKYSRVEKDKNLYTNEIRSSKFLDILLHIFITLAVLITILCWQDVYASTVSTDITNSISIPTAYSGCTQTNGKYWGDDGSSSICKVHNVKTTINGVLYNIEMVLKNAWVVNEVAFVQINGMSSDFRNNDLYCEMTNSSNVSVPCDITFNSKSQLQITFIPTQVGNYTLGIYSSSNSPLTGINTYGIKSVIVKQQTGDNADIINNQNQNTSDIIDNNNENTQEINNTINGAMKDIISNANCPIGPLKTGGSNFIYQNNVYLNSQGTNVPAQGYFIGKYISILPNTEYKITISANYNAPSLCFYRADRMTTQISCIAYSRNSTITVTSPSNANYMLLSYANDTTITIEGPVCNNWEKETQDETLNYLQDDSVDQEQANDFFSGFQDNDNGGISGLITKPLTIINNLLSDNSSCDNLTLPSFMGVDNAYLPSGCILWNNAPSTVITLWNTLVVGLGSYFILKKLFNDIQALKNPENDKVEVMDL